MGIVTSHNLGVEIILRIVTKYVTEEVAEEKEELGNKGQW